MKAFEASDRIDRLERLCAAMTDALDAHPERGDENCIVLLQDPERGGLQVHDYADDQEAGVALWLHLKGIFEVNGKTLMIATVGSDG